MFSRKLLGLIISAAALAAGAAPAAAVTPPTPEPHPDHIIGVLIGLESQPPPTTNSSLDSTQMGNGPEVGLASQTKPHTDGLVLDLQMPGASTWGSLTEHSPLGR